MQQQALLHFLYDRKIKSYLKSMSNFLNVLFTKDVCAVNKCSSVAEQGKEIKGKSKHLKNYLITNENTFQENLLKQKGFIEIMNEDFLISLIEEIACYISNNTQKVIFQQNHYQSNSDELLLEVNFLNKLYDISHLSMDEKNIAKFWYSVLYYNYTGKVKIPSTGTTQVEIEMKLNSLGIDMDLLNDYIIKVMLDAGISGLAGMRAILRYANQNEHINNPFALFEAGEIYYYDRLGSGMPDFNKAHNYYLKAAELNLPLAWWSLGYMYQKYRQRDSITGKVIEFSLSPNLENNDIARHATALRYYQNACAGGCGAAYNSLGNYCTYGFKILNALWNDLYPEDIKKTNPNEAFNFDDTKRQIFVSEKKAAIQEYYYSRSADLKDANGTFNYYRLLVKKIVQTTDSRERSALFYKYRNKLLNYLEYLVELEYPGACNSLALHLMRKSELDEIGLYLCKEDLTRSRAILKLVVDKNGVEHFPWAQYNYAYFFLKMQDRSYKSAINYFKLGINTGDDLCLIKCCKEFYDCLLLLNLKAVDVKTFNEKCSGAIHRIIEKEKSADNKDNSENWKCLRELGQNMWSGPISQDWILKKMGIYYDKESVNL